MSSLRRPWAWALGAAATLVAASACELIAGIDEKVAALDQGIADGGDAGPADDGGVDAPPPECARHSDCVVLHGDNWICVQPEGKCQPLLTPDCQVVHAAAIGAPPAQKIEVLTDDNTIFFGFIMDLLGSGKSAGIARSQAVELAVSEIHTVTKGIPGGPGGTRRPIAVVACSETKDATSAPDPKVPAKHLVDDLHVPAIIGASNSDTSIDLFNGYAFSKGTLVFSPNALSSALSSPSDNGLFWRTSATSVLQGHAIQQEIGLASDDIHGQGAASGNLKLAMVYIGDAFGTDMFPFIENGLVFNGAPLNSAPNGDICTAPPCRGDQLVLVETYPATAQNDVFQKIGNDIAAFGAHIVVLVGRKDSVQIAKAVEDNLATIGGAYLPTYIFTQGSATSDVTTILTSNPDRAGIRERVRGTLPLPSPDELTLFDPLYNTTFTAGPPPGNGVPGSYDITYLLTYAALAAGDPTKPLTGARMNDGLKKVVDPTAPPNQVFKTGAADLGRAMDAISVGQKIDVKGFSYTFEFDPNLGEAPGKVELWCVGSPANALVPSPWIWDPFVDAGATTLADGGPLPSPPGFACPPTN